jgi:SagB-type dehydrogenase family enzyme
LSAKDQRSILEKVAALESSDRDVFLTLVYEKELEDDYHAYLKAADEKSRISLIEKFAGGYRRKLDEWIESARAIDAEQGHEIRGQLEICFNLIEEKKSQMLNLSKQAKDESIQAREHIKSQFHRLTNVLSDQNQEVPHPPIFKTHADSVERIVLPAASKDCLGQKDLFDCISERKSRRKFNEEALSIEELSFLLWATQGVKQTFSHNRHAFRTVPSGGARHPFETYLAIFHVQGIAPGLYHYLPFEHSLVLVRKDENLAQELIDGCNGQPFAGKCAVNFIWTTIPYRTEWRYTLASDKIILQDSGHLCQNLYLACEAIDAGTCAIGAYDQKKLDGLLGVDGEDEFAIYISPVGKY